MTRDAGAGERPSSSTHESAIAEEVEIANRSRLAWKEEHLRVWDLLQLVTPWLLLTISTTIYFSWVLPASGKRFWPEGASVLGLVAVSALWVLFGHTLPIRRRTLRPVPTAIYFVGLLALCVTLMTYSDIFLVFTIAGFFHAYLLKPSPVGVLGVLANSVALNGSPMGVWANPTVETVAEFILIVAVQTAAIGAGILLTARSEPEERKREKLVERLEAALHENAGLHAQLVAQARESGAQDERQRLAGEIHDTLAQGLAGIITQLQAAERTASVRGETEEHVTRTSARAQQPDRGQTVRAGARPPGTRQSAPPRRAPHADRAMVAGRGDESAGGGHRRPRTTEPGDRGVALPGRAGIADQRGEARGGLTRRCHALVHGHRGAVGRTG